MKPRPRRYAELYREDGLTGGHVIMLGADDASKAAALAALRAYPGGLQMGGGVTTDNAVEYLEVSPGRGGPLGSRLGPCLRL